MIAYPQYAQELKELLTKDQKIWKEFWKENYKAQGTPMFDAEFKKVRQQLHSHTERMLQILDVIGEPSIGNIGTDGAQAMSILALHDSIDVLKMVLNAFQTSLKRNKRDTYFQAIPSMVDRVRILERKPQKFGTQWELDRNGEPFLPTVEDFKSVNKRRVEYGIEPLRWLRSMAIPESEQSWLKRPLSELVMRDITDEEFARNYKNYLSSS